MVIKMIDSNLTRLINSFFLVMKGWLFNRWLIACVVHYLTVNSLSYIS